MIKDISKRKFLNPVSSSNNGSLKWTIRVEQYEDDDGDQQLNVNGQFIIFDCRKGISLDLYGETVHGEGRRSYKANIQKLRWLAEHANECADKMQEYWDEVME